MGSTLIRPGYPDDVFLRPGWTLTRHRNENDDGLVLIELDPQGDQNGVRAMHTLGDGDLLNHADRATAQDRVRRIGPIAWEVVTPSTGSSLGIPEAVLDAFDQVFDALSGTRRIALRDWVGYAGAVARRLAPLDRAVDGPEGRQVVSEELWHLNLFPDPQLFERPTTVARRLVQNSYMAEMKTPQGKDMPDEQLGQRIDDVELHGVDGQPLTKADSDPVRLTMRAVQDAGGPELEKSVEFRVWEQLFERKKAVVGLGAQIRALLEDEHPERLDEFDAIKVLDGLDDGESDAALELLRGEANGEEISLVDCLSPALRKKVDRLAFQGERVEPDPLIALLYGLNAMEPDSFGAAASTVTLEWEATSHGATRSAQLFAFLYRQTLVDVAEACDGTVGRRFVLSDQIERIPSMEDLFLPGTGPDDDDDDREEQLQQQWAPMRFRLSQTGSSTPLVRFRWDPRTVAGLAAFSFLVGSGGVPGQIELPPLDEWCDSTFDAIWPEGDSDRPEPVDDLVKIWVEASSEHFGQWVKKGMSVAGIDSYLDAWAPLLEEATVRYVPKGGGLKALDEFLVQDTAVTTDGRYVMLGTHPIRLRWFRHHLAQVGEFIRDSLLGELRLNPENDRVFFQWIERVSPHRQPPLMSPGSQQLATSVREVQLHEEYALVPSGEDRAADWLGTLDSTSIDELVGTTKSFLTAFPHKLEGLNVLLMATSGAAGTARRYVEQLRKREYAHLDLELHVVTPSEDHDEVAAALAVLDSDEGRGSRLLPPFRLLLHPWEGGIPESFDGLTGRIDVALAPNLFGLHSTALEETRRGDPSIGGHFDPWIDATTHTRPTDDNIINVSQVLLPTTPDPVLQCWSTLSVRRKRQAPIAAEETDSIDFVTLQVAFDKNVELFNALHLVANWVVTLDPFVGRDQIDALSAAPDIIVVKSDVGKNENNTLVVSSAAGRVWVERQLAVRLSEDFALEPSRAEAISSRLYEIGRHVVPGLMLRALGLGRTAEEILGLVLARYAVDHFDPDPVPDGCIEYWISLDEHTEWFGGMNRMRPDLLRVRLVQGMSGTRLELLVLESKFRQRFDLGSADEQVLGGTRLFDAAFEPGEGAYHDVKFWRRELLTAMDELSHRDAPEADLPAVRTLSGSVDEKSLLDDIRSGEYGFSGSDALISATGWADLHGPEDPWSTSPGDNPLLRLSRVTVLSLLGRIERGLAPRDLDRSDPVDTPTVDPDLVNEAVVPVETEVWGGSGEPALEDHDSGPAPVEPVSDSPTIDRPDIEFEEQVATDDDAVALGMDRGLSPQDMELRYSKVLAKLDQLGVQVSRSESQPYQEGPGFCLYRIVPNPGVSADRVMGKLGDLKLALELPAELNIRSYVDKGTVVFEVPKEDADRYYVSADSLWQRADDKTDALAVPIGEDIEGDVVTLDFSSSETPHLLIAGQTGSGKSIALETILTGLCRHKTPEQLQLLLVDPKGTELLDLEGDPHVRGSIGMDAVDALEILTAGVAEMNERYGQFRERRTRTLPDFNAAVPQDAQLPWWLIVLDEYADLTSDADDRKAIEAELKRVAQKGRAAGIHLIVATQKPSAEVISTVIRSNLPAQLALRVKSATDSRIILEEAGAESLAGKGDAFLRTAHGLRRVQCAKVN